MGVCLSCLRGNGDDDELNETSSLLRNQQNLYSSDYIQEAELLKQQQRQQELNTIVNDLSDNLIDVSTFLNTTVTSSSQPTTPNLLAQSNPSLHSGYPHEHEANGSVENEYKSYPRIYSAEEKAKVESDVSKISDAIKDASKISFSESLYVRL